ncbi:hypothetical protein COV11_02975 [Candidatus Woesearchaeota archaeon CG10_big_fil_rev_8_21_14_0_10_30_7]|nr:MAG: hypothetical protein COV11_02975 [Candidatus Woesearchaeota archaeon CG10_big_fil_rev_8_21_14_0_10_30_7]
MTYLNDLTDEEKWFALSGDKTSPVFARKVTEAKVFINEFCGQYEVELVNIDVTMEEGYYEPCYAFTDDLGFYTLQGILNSLE